MGRIDPVRARLRRAALSHTLRRSPSLGDAIDDLGYIQADPIRSPARAQDLILRHRVSGYRAGDLERAYRRLSVEEDMVVNYGFVSRRVHRLMHPRPTTIRAAIDQAAPGLTATVLDHVRTNGPTHPRDLEPVVGAVRVGNAWGGVSQASTRALEALHHRGLLRVAWREEGIKVYDAATPFDEEPPDPLEAARQLVALLVDQLAPIPARTLSVTLLGYGAGHLDAHTRIAIAEAKARLPRTELDGQVYLWPADHPAAGTEGGDTEGGSASAPDRVRFLAPFDPVVWDRRRFEHLWGWEYRFEAYTPPAKRRFGYYALPLGWRDDVIGWVNASVVDSRLHLDLGSARGGLPSSRSFTGALDAEAGRFARFLGVHW